MSVIDPLRALAFERVYPVSPSDDRSDNAGQSELESLTPEQRQRVQNMASRRLAFQILYELDASGATDPATSVQGIIRGVPGLGPLVAQQVSALTLGAFGAKATADEEFARLAPEWPTHRQALVDRAILRLCHYEMTAGVTPPKIVVSEGVELARWFSTEKSPAFINALLDHVLKRLESAGQGAA